MFCIFQMEKVCEYSSLAEGEMTPQGSGTKQGPSGCVRGEGRLERDGNTAFIKGKTPPFSAVEAGIRFG